MKIKYGISILLFAAAIPISVEAWNPDDFRLLSATDGSSFTLSTQKGKYVALHFLLKTECPVCLRHTQEYFNRTKELPGVVQVFIKPDTKEEIEAWAKNLSPDELMNFPIYRDPDASLASKFNIPDGYAFHNQIVHYPALILIGPDGKEVFRYIGKNNGDRFSFDRLVSILKELNGGT